MRDQVPKLPKLTLSDTINDMRAMRFSGALVEHHNLWGAWLWRRTLEVVCVLAGIVVLLFLFLATT